MSMYIYNVSQACIFYILRLANNCIALKNSLIQNSNIYCAVTKQNHVYIYIYLQNHNNTALHTRYMKHNQCKLSTYWWWGNSPQRRIDPQNCWSGPCLVCWWRGTPSSRPSPASRLGSHQTHCVSWAFSLAWLQPKSEVVFWCGTKILMTYKENNFLLP